MARWAVGSSVMFAVMVAALSAVASGQTTPDPQRPAQTSSSSSSQGAAVIANALPVDVDKIKTAVHQAPHPLLNLSGIKARFYIRVDAKDEIKFTDFIHHFDLLNGPVPRAGQTYAEFMQMVTPKELYSVAGIKPTEELQMALTGFLGQMLARKAIDEIKKARTDKQIQEIRDRITRELAALTGTGPG